MKRTRRLAAAGALLAGTTYVLLLPASAETFANTAPITIPVLGPTVPAPWPGQPYPSNITVAGLAGTVTDVNLTLNGFDCSAAGNDFAYPEDIDMLLVGPTGANVVVLSDIGGANGNNANQFANLTVTLDDQAANALPADTLLASGTYRPLDDDNDPGEQVATDTFPVPAPAPSSATSLAVFNGTAPNGTWSLYVADDFQGPDNCLVNRGWTLDILTNGTGSTTTTVPATTTTVPATTTTVPATTTTVPATTTTVPATTTTVPATTTTVPATTTTVPATTTTVATTTSTSLGTTTTLGTTSTTMVPPTDASCRGMQATIVGTPGDDDLTGTPGNDVIVGFGGNDRILGLAGDDVICGGGGDDRLVGGSGADRVIGGDGADYIAGDTGEDELVGGAGDDTIRGGANNDTLDGKDGTDECRAGAGADSVLNCEA